MSDDETVRISGKDREAAADLLARLREARRAQTDEPEPAPAPEEPAVEDDQGATTRIDLRNLPGR